MLFNPQGAKNINNNSITGPRKSGQSSLLLTKHKAHFPYPLVVAPNPPQKHMINFIQEFKKFAVKGNMIDLAIGVVIGAAFNRIVDVLVKKIITPPLGYLTAGVNLADMELVLKAPVSNADGEVTDPGVVIGYGAFLEAMMDFLIVALTLFVVIKAVNTLKDKAEDEENKTVPTPKDIQLLSEIRDEMRQLNNGKKDPKPAA